MRIATELRVKALLRRCNGMGVPAVVVRRGDADAGVLFVQVRRLDGTARLLGPPPPGVGADDPMPRLMPQAGLDGVEEATIDRYLARQTQFDGDLWVIEVEDRHGAVFLDE